jgi:hypothetical protein
LRQRAPTESVLGSGTTRPTLVAYELSVCNL